MLSDPLSPFYAVVTMAFAFAVAAILEKRYPMSQHATRVSPLDGLRGFLVLAVYIGHASIWYDYLQNGVWRLPPSHFYGNLGQASVALFFMITGFLFYSKLLHGRGREVDWIRIFVSRVLRLGPLYVATMLVVLTVVAARSGFELSDSPGVIGWCILKWTAFGLGGMPDINGVRHTAAIVAGVLWTLPYEWLFYLALPILAPVAGAKPSRTAFLLAGAAAGLVAWQMHYPKAVILSIFLGGIGAAYCVKSARLRGLCAGKAASAVGLLCLAAAMGGFPSAYAPLPVVLLSIVFTIVACGNSLFGILTVRSVRFLGDMGYSVYLLHGIVLYVAFHPFASGNARWLETPWVFWGMVSALSAPLLCICHFTFRFIELPAMRAVPGAHRVVTALYRRASGATTTRAA